jgi:hypothetical protein
LIGDLFILTCLNEENAYENRMWQLSFHETSIHCFLFTWWLHRCLYRVLFSTFFPFCPNSNWRKTKYALGMYVLPRVNFINILSVHFSYESYVLAAFSSYVLALAPKFRTKNCVKNVDEIDTSCPFATSRTDWSSDACKHK